MFFCSRVYLHVSGLSQIRHTINHSVWSGKNRMWHRCAHVHTRITKDNTLLIGKQCYMCLISLCYLKKYLEMVGCLIYCLPWHLNTISLKKSYGFRAFVDVWTEWTLWRLWSKSFGHTINIIFCHSLLWLSFSRSYPFPFLSFDCLLVLIALLLSKTLCVFFKIYIGLAKEKLYTTGLTRLSFS